jgi:hypothetical protein
VVDKVTLGQVSFRVLRLFHASIIPPPLLPQTPFVCHPCCLTSAIDNVVKQNSRPPSFDIYALISSNYFSDMSSKVTVILSLILGFEVMVIISRCDDIIIIIIIITINIIIMSTKIIKITILIELWYHNLILGSVKGIFSKLPDCFTQPPIQSVLGVFPSGVKLTIHLHLVPKIGISGDIPLLLHIPSMAYTRTTRLFHIISDLLGKIFSQFSPSASITETKDDTPLKYEKFVTTA